MAQLFAQGRDLIKMHHEEASGLGLPLFLDERVFYTLEEANVLIVLGLFTLQGRLVGYTAGTVTQHPYADTLVCSAHAIFVHPGYRRCGNGRRLMDTIEHEARARGAITMWHAKPGSKFDLVLRARRCRELETVYIAR